MSLLNIIYYKGSNGQALKFAQEMLDLGIVKIVKLRNKYQLHMEVKQYQIVD